MILFIRFILRKAYFFLTDILRFSYSGISTVNLTLSSALSAFMLPP